jgi:hypothetical protein
MAGSISCLRDNEVPTAGSGNGRHGPRCVSGELTWQKPAVDTAAGQPIALLYRVALARITGYSR